MGVVVDTDTANGECLEAAIELAAGVIAHLSRGEALVDVLVVGDAVHELLVGRSLGTLDQALELLATASSATTALPALARGGAMLVLVVSVLIGVLPKRSNVKTHGVVIFAMLAVALSGLTRTGWPYPIACAVFALMCLSCLRAPVIADRMRAAPARREPIARGHDLARIMPLVLVVVVGATVASSLLLALPPASAFAERQIQRYAGDVMLREDERIGFATNIRVGALGHLLKSDRVVMRVDGDVPELLRGAVQKNIADCLTVLARRLTPGVRPAAPAAPPSSPAPRASAA